MPTHRRMNEQTYNDVKIPFSNFSRILMTNKFSREIFEISTNISLYAVQCGGTERERDGIYGSKLTVSVCHCKCAAHLQNTREISGLLTDSGADNTLLLVRLPYLHTRSVVWHKCFEFGKSRFQTPHWNFIVWISLRHCLVTLLITSLQLPSWLVQFITSYTTHRDLMSRVLTE
jgi:hypothetical protein